MTTIEELYKVYVEHPEISTDTRRITPGSLFFALHGASFDGNDYALSALESGAVHCVVDRADVFDMIADKERVTLVDDTLTALQQLAQYHRKALDIKVLAIAGSNGKTTTKELLASVLARKYNLHATRGNLNNHIGVPLTLLSIDEGCNFAVVEMGASSCGEIELLCEIAQPNYGILTNVGRAHLEGFGGEEGVRRGKGELLDYLVKSGGVAFIAAENETIRTMAEERSELRTILYDYSLADGVKYNLEGEYNRYNVAAAVAVGTEFGVDHTAIIEAIGSYMPNNNRSQRCDTERNRLIVDCYNANPSSMEASITNFARESFPDREQKIMILGDMFELGEWSIEEHRRVVELALVSDAQKIYLVGKNFGETIAANALNDSRISHFCNREELAKTLTAESLEGYTILVKGSRGVGLENIISIL